MTTTFSSTARLPDKENVLRKIINAPQDFVDEKIGRASCRERV